MDTVVIVPRFCTNMQETHQYLTGRTTESKTPDAQRGVDLRVGNRHGFVEFIGETDASSLDLQEIVKFRRFSCSVYPPHVELAGLKPPVGQGLNKPAFITFFGVPNEGEAKKINVVSIFPLKGSNELH